jgi:hypothetical protein
MTKSVSGGETTRTSVCLRSFQVILGERPGLRLPESYLARADCLRVSLVADSSSFAQLPHLLGGPVMSPVVGDIEVPAGSWMGRPELVVCKNFESGVDEQCRPV